jgi:hypothetical protein
LKQLGVPVIKSLKKKHHGIIENWIRSDEIVEVDYPDITDAIIDKILADYQHEKIGVYTSENVGNYHSVARKAS